MSVAFANVTDIKIPEGNVTKIQETATGRVLWEKNSYPDINMSWMRVSSVIGPIAQNTSMYVPKIKKIVNTNLIIDPTVYKPKDCSTKTMCCLHIEDNTDYNANRLNDVAIVSPKVVSPQDNRYCGLYAPYSFSEGGYDRPGATVLGVSPAIRDPETSSTGHAKSKGFLILKDTKSKKYGLCIYNELAAPLVNNSEINYVMNGVTSISAGKTWVIYCPKYDEFLITGLGSSTERQLCIVRASSYAMTCYSTEITKATWVEELGLYFGFVQKSSSKNNVSYSSSGVSWTEVPVFSSGGICGVEWLSKKKKLCAIGFNNAQIALSSDGKTWKIKSVPFTNALACAYSPDMDVLCVLTNKKAYATRDMINWHEVDIPNASKESVNFHDIVHVGYGVFLGYEYDGTRAYFLSVAYSMQNLTKSSYFGLVQI